MTDLLTELSKPHHCVWYKRKWLRLEEVYIAKTSGTVTDKIPPISMYIFALMHKHRFPTGVFVLHLDQQCCLLFRPGQRPIWSSIEDGVEFVRSRLTLGSAISASSLYIIQYGKYNKGYKQALQA